MLDHCRGYGWVNDDRYGAMAVRAGCGQRPWSARISDLRRRGWMTPQIDAALDQPARLVRTGACVVVASSARRPTCRLQTAPEVAQISDGAWFYPGTSPLRPLSHYRKVSNSGAPRLNLWAGFPWCAVRLVGNISPSPGLSMVACVSEASRSPLLRRACGCCC